MVEGNETESLVNVMVLGNAARGSINPADRVKSGDINDEQVDRVAESLSNHYEWVDGELREKAIPKWCVDGRVDQEGMPLAPNAAGGSYSLVIGEALIDAKGLVSGGETSASHGKKMFTGLLENGYEVGGHIDNHANSEKCGCGACDRQAEIISFLGDNIDVLSNIAAELGVEIDDVLKDKISSNAHHLVANKYVSSGNEMISVLKDVGGENSVQTLRDAHNEVVLAVNNKVGTTLNRRSLEAEFGSDYEAFNLDVWALKNGIDAISSSEVEAKEKFAAAALYNIATACVLAGPSLRVVVV